MPREAVDAAVTVARWSATERGRALDGVATALRAHAEQIVAVSRAETGLAEARIRGERPEIADVVVHTEP